MTAYQTAVLRAIAAALMSKRDRYRRLDVDPQVAEAVRGFIRGTKGKARAPHGGLDTLDQCSMLLQGLLGDVPQSVIELDKVRS